MLVKKYNNVQFINLLVTFVIFGGQHYSKEVNKIK